MWCQSYSSLRSLSFYQVTSYTSRAMYIALLLNVMRHFLIHWIRMKSSIILVWHVVHSTFLCLLLTPLLEVACPQNRTITRAYRLFDDTNNNTVLDTGESHLDCNQTITVQDATSDVKWLPYGFLCRHLHWGSSSCSHGDCDGQLWYLYYCCSPCLLLHWHQTQAQVDGDQQL